MVILLACTSTSHHIIIHLITHTKTNKKSVLLKLFNCHFHPFDLIQVKGIEVEICWLESIFDWLLQGSRFMVAHGSWNKAKVF